MESNTILLGDARKLCRHLPAESVDLIFTDPVYENLGDYAWLWNLARRVLKPTGQMLVWASAAKVYQIRTIIEPHFLDLHFIWELSYVVTNKSSKLKGRNLYTHRTPCLWYAKKKGARRNYLGPDSYVSAEIANKTNRHKWNKNEAVIEEWLRAFSKRGHVICDPFTGGGTVPVLAKKTGRTFYACEINPEYHSFALNRLEATQEQVDFKYLADPITLPL